MGKRRSGKPPPFGARLKALREDSGLTQGELAARAGLPLQRVFKLEQGYQLDPRWSTVYRLAVGLGVSVAEFAGEPATESDGAAPPKKPRGRPRKGLNL